MLSAPMHPKLPELGERAIPFSKTILIDSEDFSEVRAGRSCRSTVLLPAAQLSLATPPTHRHRHLLPSRSALSSPPLLLSLTV
eukprot:385680-Prymnesium_polylepis.1